MFRSIHELILRSDWTRKPLSSLIVYEASIYRHVRLTFLLAESPLSRTEQLTVILQQSLLMVR